MLNFLRAQQRGDVKHSKRLSKMSTAQKYRNGNSYAISTPQTALKTRSNTSTTDNWQLPTLHADLAGLDLDELNERIRTSAQPIHCPTILDGISLVRGMRINPSQQDLDAHYALLLRDSIVVGIACLNMEGEVNCEVDGDYLPAYTLNVRYLMTNLLETSVTSVLLLSTRTHPTSNMFDSHDLEFINQVWTSLQLLDVSLLDWAVLTYDANMSWRWQYDKAAWIYYRNVSEQELINCGTPYAEAALA